MSKEAFRLFKIIRDTDLIRCSSEQFDEWVGALTKFKALPIRIIDGIMRDNPIPQEQPKLAWSERVAAFRQLYLEGQPLDKPIVVACSWGKDSTVLLRVAQEGVLSVPPEQRTRTVHVITSDTGTENPKLRDYIYRQTAQLNDWAQANDVPMQAHILKRPTRRSILVSLLAKGYPLPGVAAKKWCTHALKIEPQDAFMKRVKPAFLLVGTRLDESNQRKRTINKYRFTTGLVSYSPFNRGIKLWTGVVDMTIDDIWNVLAAPLPHSSSHEVRQLYAEATGECGLTNPNGANEYSNACSARFGCWLCPVVLNDKSTETMAESNEWMVPLTVWRKRLIEEFNKPENRSGYTRRGKPAGYQKGCIVMATRKTLLAELLATQDEYNELRADAGLPYDALITQEELDMIYAQWAEDEAERPWLIDNSEYRPGDFEAAAQELADKKAAKEQRKKEMSA